MRRIAILCLFLGLAASGSGCATHAMRADGHAGVKVEIETPTVAWNPTVHVTLELKR